jgi:hypothetical protein
MDGLFRVAASVFTLAMKRGLQLRVVPPTRRFDARERLRTTSLRQR